VTPADAGPLLRIVSIVFPIFALVAIGWAYARYRRARGGLDMAFANELNMDVFVPALVISAMVTKSFELASYQWLAVGAALVMLGSG
jgi:predicted permease